ncbi:MAG TPA: TetR/AcrR family transcriptional regulator [Smithellaceae bacterium]|nr:TetR/AcrR family transcriptional regulator [Smithellaceae bacterium]
MGAKERREREREQRKRHILDTARKLLLEKGLTATSINQIAKRSELSVGAIYFYFKDKEELFAALQFEGLDLLRQNIHEAVSPECSPEEKIRSIARAYLHFSEEHKNYYDIINYFLTSPETIFPPNLKTEIDEHGNASIFTLAAAVREGIDKGIFKEVDPRRQAIILWSAFNGVIQLKKLEKTILAKDEYKSIYLETVERFLDGLRR